MKKTTCLPSMVKTACLSLVVLALPSLALADNVPAIVVSVSGDATVVDTSGKSSPIKIGDKLPAGDTVITGKDGTVGLVLVPGAGTVVQPDTNVELSTLVYTKVGTQNNRTILLNLKNGDLISTLAKHDGNSDMKVATPYGVAAAKGTSLRTIVRKNALSVVVLNGVVEVGYMKGGQFIVVGAIPAGQIFATIAAIDANTSFSTTRAGERELANLQTILTRDLIRLDATLARAGVSNDIIQQIQQAVQSLNPSNTSSSTTNSQTTP